MLKFKSSVHKIRNEYVRQSGLERIGWDGLDRRDGRYTGQMMLKIEQPRAFTPILFSRSVSSWATAQCGLKWARMLKQLHNAPLCHMFSTVTTCVTILKKKQKTTINKQKTKTKKHFYCRFLSVSKVSFHLEILSLFFYKFLILCVINILCNHCGDIHATLRCTLVTNAHLLTQ